MSAKMVEVSMVTALIAVLSLSFIVIGSSFELKQIGSSYDSSAKLTALSLSALLGNMTQGSEATIEFSPVGHFDVQYQDGSITVDFGGQSATVRSHGPPGEFSISKPGGYVVSIDYGSIMVTQLG